MSLTDPIGDMLTRIRNAQMRRRDTVATPASTLRGRVLDVLKSEGFIRGYTEQKTDAGHNEYEIEGSTLRMQRRVYDLARGQFTDTEKFEFELRIH